MIFKECKFSLSVLSVEVCNRIFLNNLNCASCIADFIPIRLIVIIFILDIKERIEIYRLLLFCLLFLHISLASLPEARYSISWLHQHGSVNFRLIWL